MSSVSGSLYLGALAELGRFDTDAEDQDQTLKRAREPVNQRKVEPTTAEPDQQPDTRHLDRSVAIGYNDNKDVKRDVFSLTPPPRGHRSAASVPLAELSTIGELSPAVQRMAVSSPRHRIRSKSIGTMSVDHSINDSVTGLLLPADSKIGRNPLPHPSTLPSELAFKNDLNPDQRAVLLRRAKKLEQLLGQSLDERSIERLSLTRSIR